MQLIKLRLASWRDTNGDNAGGFSARCNIGSHGRIGDDNWNTRSKCCLESGKGLWRKLTIAQAHNGNRLLSWLRLINVRRCNPEWSRRLIGNRVTDVERILRAKDLLQRHV